MNRSIECISNTGISKAEISYREIISYPLFGLVWFVKGNYAFNYAFPCVNSPCIAKIMICYVLVIQLIILNRVYNK